MDPDLVAMETDPLAKSSDSDTLSHSTSSLADPASLAEQSSGLALEPGEIRLPPDDGADPMDTDGIDATMQLSGLDPPLAEDPLISSQPTNSTEVLK